MGDLGKTFIFFGLLFFIGGILLTVFGKIPWFGKLPGDILIKKENVTFYFPLATSILISIMLSLLMFLWNQRH